jgi:hypothetical protein
VLVALPKVVAATVVPYSVTNRSIAVYNVYTAALTFEHEGCACDTPLAPAALPCHIGSFLAVKQCSHDLDLGATLHITVQLLPPTAAGLYEHEWRMFPTTPAGMPQFWDATAVVAVVADPAMLAPERTALTVVTRQEMGAWHLVTGTLALVERGGMGTFNIQPHQPVLAGSLAALQPFDIWVSLYDLYGNDIAASGRMRQLLIRLTSPTGGSDR